MIFMRISVTVGLLFISSLYASPVSAQEAPKWIGGVDIDRHAVIFHNMAWNHGGVGRNRGIPKDEWVAVSNGTLPEMLAFFNRMIDRKQCSENESDVRHFPCNKDNVLFLGQSFFKDQDSSTYVTPEPILGWQITRNAYCDGLAVFKGDMSNGFVSDAAYRVDMKDTLFCIGTPTHSPQNWLLNSILGELRAINQKSSGIESRVIELERTLLLLGGKCPTDPSKTIDPATGACRE